MTQRLPVGKTVGKRPCLKFTIHLSYLTIADKFACRGTENCPCGLYVGKVVCAESFLTHVFLLSFIVQSINIIILIHPDITQFAEQQINLSLC